MDGDKLDPGLEGYSDSGSDFYDFQMPDLPIGLVKKVLRQSVVQTTKMPTDGDEVCVRCKFAAGPETSLPVGTSEEARGELIRFIVGHGNAMRALEAVVVTMREGEVAEVRISADSMPELSSKAGTYRVELIEWFRRLDLFGDNSVEMVTVQQRGDRRRPVIGQLCLLICRGSRLDGQESGVCGTESNAVELEYSIGDGLAAVSPISDILPVPGVLDKALLSMKRGERVMLRCKAGVLSSVAPATIFDIELTDFVESCDASFEQDGSIVKTSRHSRDAWPRCREGGRCSLRVLRASSAEPNFKPCLVSFVVGNGEVCDALECATLSMRCGERAFVICREAEVCSEPQLGIIGIAGLELEVEVIAYDEGGWEHAHSGSQKLAFAEARKSVAAKLVKEGRLQLAAHLYKQAHELLGYVDYERARGSGAESEEGEWRRADASALRGACMCNRALCLLRLGLAEAAVAACALSLEEGRSAKALFLRARARLSLGDCQEAERDAGAALELEPRSGELRRLRSEIARGRAQQDREAKATFSRMCAGLGSLPHPLDVD